MRRAWALLAALAVAATADAGIRRYQLRPKPGRSLPGHQHQYIVADTAAELPTVDVYEGDLAYSKDDDKAWKRTSTGWEELGGGAPGGGVEDGDKGDITVSGDGEVWTIDSNAIADGDIPSGVARDTEVTSAVSDHAGAADPHTGYQRESVLEADVEAVVDLDQLQGQVADAQIADGAVDGGNGGEIADASVTADDLGADSVSASELNATGVEAELEAVLDIPELQGQLGDAQIAAGAVDGGNAGEIADGSVTADDLGTDSVSADELAAAGVESELEAVLDLEDLQGALTVAKGGAGAAPAAGDQVLVSDSTSAATWKTLPDCDTAGTSKLLYDQGTNAWSCGTDQTGGGWTKVTQGSDVTNSNSSAYSAVSGLNFAVSASTNYHARCQLYTSAAAAGTTGLQIQIQGPGSATRVRIMRGYLNNSATVWTLLSSTAFNSSANDDAAAGSHTSSNFIHVNELDMMLEIGGSAGTISWAIQTEVNSSGVTVYKGSYCEYQSY